MKKQLDSYLIWTVHETRKSHTRHRHISYKMASFVLDSQSSSSERRELSDAELRRAEWPECDVGRRARTGRAHRRRGGERVAGDGPVNRACSSGDRKRRLSSIEDGRRQRARGGRVVIESELCRVNRVRPRCRGLELQVDRAVLLGVLREHGLVARDVKRIVQRAAVHGDRAVLALLDRDFRGKGERELGRPSADLNSVEAVLRGYWR